MKGKYRSQTEADEKPPDFDLVTWLPSTFFIETSEKNRACSTQLICEGEQTVILSETEEKGEAEQRKHNSVSSNH